MHVSCVICCGDVLKFLQWTCCFCFKKRKICLNFFPAGLPGIWISSLNPKPCAYGELVGAEWCQVFTMSPNLATCVPGSKWFYCNKKLNVSVWALGVICCPLFCNGLDRFCLKEKRNEKKIVNITECYFKFGSWANYGNHNWTHSRCLCGNQVILILVVTIRKHITWALASNACATEASGFACQIWVLKVSVFWKVFKLKIEISLLEDDHNMIFKT